MLDFNKVENVITVVFLLVIIIMIDVVIRGSELLDICYLVFMSGSFLWFLYMKNK